jgi:hypothetical protein
MLGEVGRDHNPEICASFLSHNDFCQSRVTLGGTKISFGLFGKRFRDLGKVTCSGTMPGDEIFALPAERFHGRSDPFAVNIVS